MPVPDFSPGEVLTAAAMDSIGLWLVKTQTIGTGVSSISVTDVFSADYENYKIVVSGGVASTNNLFRLKLGTTAAGYYYALQYVAYNSTPLAVGVGNTNFVDYAGVGTTNNLNLNMDILSPFLTKHSFFNGKVVNGTAWAGTIDGMLNNTTSYTGFTLEASTGTFTGGTIRVYGYRN